MNYQSKYWFFNDFDVSFIGLILFVSFPYFFKLFIGISLLCFFFFFPPVPFPFFYIFVFCN